MKNFVFIMLVLFSLFFVVSCGKKDDTKDLSEQEQIDAVNKLLRKTSLTEDEWTELEYYLKAENRKSLAIICEKDMDDAIKNKNWRLLKIATKHGFGFKINNSWRWDVIENKEFNYNGDDILEFYSIVGFEINDLVFNKAIENDYKIGVLLLRNMPEKNRSYIRFSDPKKIQAALEIGMIDQDRALLECEKINSVDKKLFNKLLKWKRQTSKVWTLY